MFSLRVLDLDAAAATSRIEEGIRQQVLGEMKKHTAAGRVTVRYERYHEPAIDVTLAVGILKNPSKFDFLVEKECLVLESLRSFFLGK